MCVRRYPEFFFIENPMQMEDLVSISHCDKSCGPFHYITIETFKLCSRSSYMSTCLHVNHMTMMIRFFFFITKICDQLIPSLFSAGMNAELGYISDWVTSHLAP